MELEQMKELIKAVSESDVKEFFYKEGNIEISITNVTPEPITVKQPTQQQPPIQIISNAPMPAPAPMAPPVSMPMAPQPQVAQPVAVSQPQVAQPVAVSQPQVAPVVEQPIVEESSYKVVKSPLVGTFYCSASPEAEPFVKVGDRVSAGQVLGIVEAMKLMNEIESEFDGEIVEIMVNNKDMVEYDQPLFKLK